MMVSLQDLLYCLPMYQLAFFTPLPKEHVYYEKIASCISDQRFESPTLLVIQTEEECIKLNKKELAFQLIQDRNLIGIIICLQKNIPIQEDSLSLFQQCQVPIIQVEDAAALPIFQKKTNSHYSLSQMSKELNGFMNKGFMNITSGLSLALETPFLYLGENNQLLWQVGPEAELQKAFHWLKSYERVTKNGSSAEEVKHSFEPYLINIADQISLTLIASAHLVDWQKKLIDKLIGLTALFFQTEEMFRDQQERFKEHFIYDLLYHKFEAKKVMVKQGKAWGWNLERPHHLLIINVNDSNDIMGNFEWMDELIVHLEAQISQLNETIIIFPFQDQVILLVEDQEHRNHNERKKYAIKIAEQIEQGLLSMWPNGQFCIGIGKWYQDSINLNKSYQEAKVALQFGQVWFEKKRVFHMNNLGLVRLLTHIHREILYDFSQEYLSSLIESDGENGTEYVKTLKAYILHQGIINEVSEALYVHPNTLRNRLKKIEEITGVDLQKPEEFMNLMAAVKIHFSLSL
ncbi:PucR family transcriptional regulator [Neobacillus sp. 19]|uniref:PucR family transcriptional regulator n=1 Tax=Neobacillus sp. 19 TaxID=3394458 RepID=UPI003BF64F72